MKRLLMLGAATLLVGCGADNKAASSDEGARRDAALKFAKCMRDHGVDMPDPKPGSGGRLTFEARAGDGSAPTREKMDAAQKACQKHLEKIKPNLTPEREKELQDQAVKFSACMRRHGIDFPDPQFGDDGGILMKVEPGKGPDPESPAFKKAQEECGELMPGPGGSASTESRGGSTADAPE